MADVVVVILRTVAEIREAAEGIKENDRQACRLCERVLAIEPPVLAVQQGTKLSSSDSLHQLLATVQTIRNFLEGYARTTKFNRALKRKENAAEFTQLRAVLTEGIHALHLDVAVDAWAKEDASDRLEDLENMVDMMKLMERNRTDNHAEVMDVLKALRKDERSELKAWVEVDFDKDLDFEGSTLLGSGGFGEVRTARWNGSDVAVKHLLVHALHDDTVRALRKEIRVHSSLHFDHVVQLYAASTVPPHLCLVIELASGGSLWGYLHSTREPLPHARQAAFLYDIARGMSFLHTKGILHRDLKSSNVLVFDNGRLKLCDFGLSKVKTEVSSRSKRGPVGNAQWMSPEEMDESPANELTDVYSFGVVCFEVASRMEPFKGLKQAQVIRAVADKGKRPQFPEWASASPDVVPLMEKCWEQDPAERPEGFRPVVQALASVVSRVGDPRILGAAAVDANPPAAAAAAAGSASSSAFVIPAGGLATKNMYPVEKASALSATVEETAKNQTLQPDTIPAAQAASQTAMAVRAQREGESKATHAAAALVNWMKYSVELSFLRHGHGHFGVARRCWDTATREGFVCRSFNKTLMICIESFRRMIEILRCVNHPCIIKLYEVYEDDRFIHLVMEHCTGGELFDRIFRKSESEKGHYSEKDAKVVVASILSGIEYCHNEHNICHHNLSPESFLLKRPNSDTEIKIIEFGLSRFGGEQSAESPRDKACFFAPELLLSRKYDKACDLWSIGVITYVLLAGYSPFNGESDKEIKASVRQGHFEFPSPEWDIISTEAKDFITQLLRKDPAARMSATQSINHSWFDKPSGSATGDDATADVTEEGDQVSILQIKRRMQRFADMGMLKKVALNVIAHHLTENEIGHLREVFEKLDRHNKGVIGPDALELVQSVNIDGSDSLNLREFLAATMQRKIYTREENIRLAFDYFDLDEKSEITFPNLAKLYGSYKHAREIMGNANLPDEGAIDYDLFKDLMMDVPRDTIPLFFLT